MHAAPPHRLAEGCCLQTRALSFSSEEVPGVSPSKKPSRSQEQRNTHLLVTSRQRMPSGRAVTNLQPGQTYKGMQSWRIRGLSSRDDAAAYEGKPMQGNCLPVGNEDRFSCSPSSCIQANILSHGSVGHLVCGSHQLPHPLIVQHEFHGLMHMALPC